MRQRDGSAPEASTGTAEVQANLAKVIKEGLDSSPATARTFNDIEQIKQSVIARSANRAVQSVLKLPFMKFIIKMFAAE